MTGILFDFNGTMFFDEKFQEISWRTYIGEKIGRSIGDDEFQQYIHGRNGNVTLPYFLGRPLSKEELEEMEEEKEVIYRELCLESEDFQLAPGLITFLDLLKERNVPMTIATASGWKNVQFFFEHLKLDRWFDIQKVAYNDGVIPGKPEPDLYLIAAEKLGIDIHDCIVLEDSISGVESARRAGAKAIIKVESMKQKHTGECVDLCIENYCDINSLLTLVK